jgi:hypothetical protein
LIGKVALDNIDFFVFHMYNDVETYFGQLWICLSMLDNH